MVMSLSRLVPGDIDAADRALAGRASHRRGVSLFLGVGPLHREFKLRKTQDEVVAMIEGAVEYACARFQVVAFAPEGCEPHRAGFSLPLLSHCDRGRGHKYRIPG